MNCRRPFAALGIVLCATAVSAQDLEPRAYAAAPVGTTFLVVAAGRSTGSVLTDPSLPIEDVDARVGVVAIGGGTIVNLFGRTALVVGALPIARARATGRVGETIGSVDRTGLGDARAKLSINLLGGRAVDVKEFARIARPTIVGVSLSVLAPTGQYDRTKLINLGAHRWAFKPEAGISHRVSNWTIEGYAGVVLFTNNDEFYTGSALRSQEPILALQTHVSYTFRPRLWVAADGTWYSGGTTTVDGVRKGDLQRNSRIGATMSLPIGRWQSLKFSGSTGATTRFGSDFNTLGVAWQLSWFR
jgi:hypothetical protein